MAQPYVGEIRMFAGNFAPAGWMFCEGQLLPISENETLFQLIGTTYGGDGQSTFALPDLRGRVPIHQGNGFSLAEAGGGQDGGAPPAQPPAARGGVPIHEGNGFGLAEGGGVENVALTQQQLPAHGHQLLGSSQVANDP